ncbi:MAG TPA: VOC family protein [Caulobacteraceae bacterium]|nr:VOC family protein [Caulobacteraceae bacterium]
MSNLENLKKQAKALVRLHRERSYHLAIVARHVLPKYASMSDREVLAADFKLVDAQELIARQHGCESWAQLKDASETSALALAQDAVAPASAGPVFAMPILCVADVRRAADHWKRVLGFEPFLEGDPPFYAEMRRGGASLALRQTHRPVWDAAARAEEELLWQASVGVRGVKALYLEYVAAGASISTPLRREPWGAWDFAIEDLDGNHIGFFEAPAR